MVSDNLNMMMARKGDLALVVKQDNQNKKFVIEEVNNSGIFENITGYAPEELANNDFLALLPKTIKQNINDSVDFSGNGADLLEVISKIRDFFIVSKTGNEVKVSLKIQHGVSSGSDPNFIIAMQNKNRFDNTNRLRILETTKKSKVIDSTTGIGDEKSFLEEADVVHFYVEKGKIGATLAVVRIDSFPDIVGKYGKGTGDGLLKEVVLRCSQTFRQTDILGYLGGGEFGIILLEADLENAKIPLNRLRWQLANKPLYLPGNVGVAATLSIAFKQLTKKQSARQIIEKCSQILISHSDKTNQLLDG